MSIVNFYYRIVPKLFTMAKLLNKLCWARTWLLWEMEQQQAFIQIKQVISEIPTLQFSWEGVVNFLEIDSRKAGLGDVLYQEVKGPNMGLLPVAYALRTLTKCK